MKPRFDLSLYLVVGPEQVPDHRLRSLVAEAVAGGVTLVQLRDKGLDKAAIRDRARALLSVLRPRNIPLIVNDEPEIAVAVGADGVHVGPFDRPAAEVRRLIGDAAILGLSVTSQEAADRVDPAVVDYVGLGPAYATSTKPDAAAPLGIDGLRAICRRLTVPIVAIGGIDAGNLTDVMRAGPRGVAVISAICAEEDPRTAARRLARAIRLARAESEGADA